MPKSCGDCSLCCLLPQVPEFAKPAGVWCQHCAKPGCRIYETRPERCRTFECMWLWNENMPEDLKPNRVKLFFQNSAADGSMQCYVHPQYPDAWKKPKVMALIDRMRNQGLHVVIICGQTRHFLAAPGQPIPTEIANMVVEQKPWLV